MKTKTIELDGQSYVIAPLNMEQVEAIMDAPPTSDPQALRAQVWSTICNSLANAGPTSVFGRDASISFVPPLDLATLRSQLSLPAFNALHAAILEISGLKTLPEGDAGETTAAGSTSGNSAAA